MAFTEQTLELDNAHISNLFGQFDCYLKKLERAFGTQIIDRDGTVHIRGEQSAVAHTAAVFTELQELARRGNQIQEQNVDYAIAMHMENQENTLLEIDGDLICHTVSGKPVKPKAVCGCDPGKDDRIRSGACWNRQNLPGDGNGDYRF